ncbi:MmgE/PrpD family protein [Gordonia sp. NPDC003424]
MTSIEEAVARLVVDLDYDQLTPEALEGTRRLMQDQLGLQVGCATLPWSQAVADLTRRTHAPGTARVALSGEAMSAGDAAFVNATFGHSFEYDDAHAASLSHPGSAVISAALAVGEEMGATMREVIEGIVAGYEVYTRIGTLASPDLLRRGFHPHAVLSPFGTAAVVAKMRGFDLPTTLNALAIAFSHCAGTTEYTSSGGSIKRVHSGIGARNGIRAAEMAEAGITGPARFLAGAKGFFQTFVVKDLSDEDTEYFSLLRPYEIADPLFKPYCCCAFNHAFIDGARQLTDRAADIDHVDLGIRESGDVVVGNSNVNAYAPQQIEHLQYSLPFQFALSTLGKGNGYETHRQYMAGTLDLGPEGEIAQLAQRLRIHVDAELDKKYPTKMVADITATFTDGSTEHIFVEDSVGSAPNPMSQEDSDAKFRDLTTTNLGAEQTEALLAAIKNTDPSVKAADLVGLLVAD